MMRLAVIKTGIRKPAVLCLWRRGDVCAACSTACTQRSGVNQAAGHLVVWILLFGFCRIHLNLYLLEWTRVKFNSNSTSIHLNTRGLIESDYMQTRPKMFFVLRTTVLKSTSAPG
jgi:hypothetical protein